MPLIENRDPTEPTLSPDHSARQRAVDEVSKPLIEGQDEIYGEEFFTDQEVLTYIGTAKRRARNYQQVAVMQEWEEAEAAFRSQHHDRSKYNRPQYKNRAKYFKPKTRSAVFKSLLATSVALFSSADVITTEASDDMSEMQRANAALIKELLSQRLNNKTRRMGLPWRQVVLGARQQTQVMGMCASKAYWSYKTHTRVETETVEQPVLSGDGTPIIEFATGQPFMETVQVDREVIDVIEDKPVVDLVPLEMILINPSASWINPIQSSPDLIVQHPMFADDLMSMMEGGAKSDVPWREVSEDQLAQVVFSDDELIGLKAAREGDGAKNTQGGLNKGAGQTLSGQGRMSGAVLDVWENFFRADGVDYHCWSLRDKVLLSDPVPVAQAYPAFRGNRPYHVGTDMMEPFVLYPESDVHSWQQQQAEINDLTNLRMDAMRKSIYPTALVKAGKNIDYKAVQRQDAQNLVLIRDDNDVRWDRPPGPPPSAYQEMNYLNTDFDDLAGQFSAGSVQTNRQLNETVGGMAMISQNANAVSEFKLSLFIDTWVEPVLSQLVALEQYYEDDATLLMIAGKKARLWQRFGIDEITDELLESQITISVNAGGGSSDPMARLMKFKAAFDISMPFIAMGQKDGRIELNYDELLSEVYGLAGYRNGAERFIKVKDANDEQGVPADKVKELMGAVQKQMEELRAENEKLKAGHEAKLMMKQMDVKSKAEDRQADIAVAVMETKADLQRQQMEDQHEMRIEQMRNPPMPIIPNLPPMPRRF